MPRSLGHALPRLVPATASRTVECADDWPRFAGADWPDTVMDADATDRLHQKQGRSIARWTLADGGDTLVVYLKRHFVLPRVSGLLARLLPSRPHSPGLEEARHLAAAERLGLRVPRVVAAGEYRGPGLRLSGFLAVEELTGMLPLHEAIPLASRAMPAEAFEFWKRALIREIARLTRRLHGAGYFHQDLYLCHFYVSQGLCESPPPDGFAGKVALIDFHRLTRAAGPAAWGKRAKDLAQLLYSTRNVAGVSDRDRLRCAKALGLGRRGTGRLLRRLAILKARRYARHNDRG